MLVRILTGICLLLIAIPVLYWSNTIILVLTISFLSVVAVAEMFRCLGVNKYYGIAIPSYLLAIALPAFTRYFQGSRGGEITIFACVYAYALYVLSNSMFSKGRITFALASKVFLSTAYIVCGFTSLVAIRDISKDGLFLLTMVFVVSFSSDIFAYFSGMLFGKHKLIPNVSPKKTVEGAIGGTLMSAAAFVGCGLVYSHFLGGSRPHVIALFICGVAISIVAQIGDLIASYIKREYGIKDYGRIFPGHGGVLDRFDSVNAVAPVMYLLLANESIFSIFK